MSEIVFNRHLFEMSEKYVKMEKIRQLKAKIAKNEKTIAEILSKINSNMKCCMCNSKNIYLIYCTSCHTVPVCQLHFRSCPKTKECPKCNQNSLTRRWSIPLPKNI